MMPEMVTSSDARESMAAVDLGSNSFHMIIARPTAGGFQVVDRVRESVRLAAGVDRDGRIAPATFERAIAALERLGQRIRDIPPDRVRAVGTNALRRARRAGAFLEAAQRALGHRIEILPGAEEARLIYLGVAHSVGETPGHRLVVDIGGGSTEIILGERLEPLERDSLYMGCVGYSREFFDDGKIDEERMRAAEIAAGLELRPLVTRYHMRGWELAIGASGTITAIEGILVKNGWSDSGIERAGLGRLRRAVIDAGHVDTLDLPGLSRERAPVLPGGLAILVAVFKALSIGHMTVSRGALREGLLYDLLGRMRHEDIRERTIARLLERFAMDVDQAARVERLALALLEQVAPDWRLDDASARRVLSWAARLHELGIALSYSGHHKHGAYILLHSDLPGFSKEDREMVAMLVRTHRRKVSPDLFRDLPDRPARGTMRLAVLLRIAVLLHRGRGQRIPVPEAHAERDRLSLAFPEGWLARHPLHAADLEREAKLLRPLGIALEYR